MSKPLWTSKQAVKATEGRSPTAWDAYSISIDSRTVAAGALFVALKGENFDGHEYVKDALKKGISAAVVSHLPATLTGSEPLLFVDDTEKALRDLGISRRKDIKAKVIGVTGSVGKTSVKEMLKVAFGALGKTYATEGNLNNHLGTPLSLARISEDTKFAVMEMGMNHAGEISELTKLVRPHIAIITTVEAVHLEFFKSIEAIADAKAEIFEGLEPEGTAILNRDSPHFERLAASAKAKGARNILSFGEYAQADCRLLSYKESERGAEIEASYKGEPYHYILGIKGKHQARNSLSVLAALKAAGEDVNKGLVALAGYTAQDGRGKHISVTSGKGTFTVIDDCYNASPASIRAALAVMGSNGKGRKIAVLGDMLELGEQSTALHVSLRDEILAQGIDVVYTAGKYMGELYQSLPVEKQGKSTVTSAELAPVIQDIIAAGDVVLVKGSNGMRMKEIVKALVGLGEGVKV